MKAMLPLVALTVIAGVASTYAPKVAAHLDCDRLYQECVEMGNPVGDCQLKENECWVTNHWPDSVKMFERKAKPND
jgi:hypothetical protein